MTRIILSWMLLAIIGFLTASCGSTITTKPHGEGIGLRYGVSQGQAYVISAHDTGNTEDRGTGVANWNAELNDPSNLRFPVFYQFEESLLSNWMGHNAVLSVSSFEQKDLPPTLKNDKSWAQLLEDEVRTLPKGGTWDLPSSYTAFARDYPRAQTSAGFLSKWDAADNPATSADYDLTSLSLGWSVYFFYPSSAHHRWITARAGFIGSWVAGNMSILLCDPYRVTNELTTDMSTSGYLTGTCVNRQVIDTSPITGFKGSTSTGITFYEYVGDEFEVSVMGINDVQVGHDSLADGGPDYRIMMNISEFTFVDFVMRF